MNSHKPTATTIAVMAWWKAREHALNTEWSITAKAAELGIRASRLRMIVRNAQARQRSEARRIKQAIQLEQDRAKYAAQRCLARAEEFERSRS